MACFGFFEDLGPAECAAWVQAWGSIIAILAAIGIAAWQRHQDHVRERTRERATQLRMLDTILALARRADWLVGQVPGPTTPEAAVDAFLKGVSTADYQRTLEALESISVATAPDGRSLEMVHEVAGRLSDAMRRFHALNGDFANRGSHGRRPDAWMEHARAIKDLRRQTSTVVAEMELVRKEMAEAP